MLAKKLIHIVGGGASQVPLVLKAKEQGFSVLVTDMYPDSPCRDYTDYYHVVDTTDRKGTLEIARKYKIDAIATDQTDVAVPTVAYVAEKMALPGMGLDVAEKFTNKLLMRQACNISIPNSIPRFNHFYHLTDALEYISNCDRPFIIKPINSQGSKGVFKCEDPDSEKLKIAFEESRGLGILVEQFIAGEEIALECFTQEGVTKLLAFSRKEHYPQNDCIDRRVTFFDDIDDRVKDKVASLNAKVVKAFGLINGLTHAEYKIVDGVPFLIEIAARGAGSSVSGRIIPQVTGFDVNQFVLDCASGNTKKSYSLIEQKKYALLEFLEFKQGIVSSVSINSEIIKLAEMFEMNISPGDIISDINDSRDRKGLFVVIDVTLDEIERKARLLRDAVDIVYA